MDRMTLDVLPEEMDSLPDRETTEDLRTPEVFILWTIRTWVQTEIGRHSSRQCFQDGLEKAGCQEAANPLSALLDIVGTAANRKIEIHVPTCPCISADEKRLLHALAAQQTGHTLEAFDVLTNLLPGAAVRIALGYVDAVALSLARAGLLLPDRAWHLKELSLAHRLRAPRSNSTCVRYQLH